MAALSPPARGCRIASERLFIACELPPAWHEALADCQTRLRLRLGQAASALRWVRSESFHLTLVFLGETAVDDQPRIIEMMVAAAAGVRPFELRLGELGSFGGSRPRVVWARTEGDTAALSLIQRRLAQALGLSGEEAERFSPHITLARSRDRQRGSDGATLDVPRLAGAIAAVRLPELQPFRLQGISLMQSELQRGGALYSRRAFVPLQSD